MEHIFRKASTAELGRALEIIDEAKQQMRKEGKNQWNETYPARRHIENDIANGNAYVILIEGQIVAYGAVVFTGEPAYDDIQGNWLSNQPYVVLHRLAVTECAKGHGIGLIFIQEVENLSLSAGVHSFKVDTNYDNERMKRLLNKSGFTYCGKISYPQGTRMAYEKILK